MSNGNKDKRTEKRRIGDIGENVACTFLVKRGFTIVDRNYLKKYGEIDIVAEKSGKYHFIEVKTVTVSESPHIIDAAKLGGTDPDDYRPEDNVHPWKLQRLARAIQVYLAEKKLWTREWMIDVITVRLNMQTKRANIQVLDNIIL